MTRRNFIERPGKPVKPTPRSLESRGVKARDITLDVISPLFGGGVHVDSDENRRQLKRPDPVTAVRGASIRGQLRFWWRTTRGSRCATIDAMRELESKLWGAASSPGRVALAVRGRVTTREEPIFEMRQSRSGKWNPRPLGHARSVAYAAFPLQPPGSKPMRLEPGVLHWVQGRPTVQIRFDPRGLGDGEATREWQGIQDAVDAWLMFGGLGGRTRRGFGAVAGDATVDPKQTLARMKAASGQLTGMPSLAGAELRVMGRRFANAMQAVSAGLERLQTFRQGPEVGRNKGQEHNRPGRSRWPEPEVIRELTRQSDPQHRQRLVKVDKTPRAEFGLPIIFHFKDRSDPGDTTLTPAGAERRASPIIIRPYPVGDRYGVFALRLSGEQTGALTLKAGRREHPVDATLTADEARRVRPLNGKADVLAAFLDFFASTD